MTVDSSTHLCLVLSLGVLCHSFHGCTANPKAGEALAFSVTPPLPLRWFKSMVFFGKPYNLLGLVVEIPGKTGGPSNS